VLTKWEESRSVAQGARDPSHNDLWPSHDLLGQPTHDSEAQVAERLFALLLPNDGECIGVLHGAVAFTDEPVLWPKTIGKESADGCPYGCLEDRGGQVGQVKVTRRERLSGRFPTRISQSDDWQQSRAPTGDRNLAELAAWISWRLA